jgi:prepilin peptidase CpaA
MLTGAIILIKAVTIALLCKVAIADFQTQKISNRHVLMLGTLGIAHMLLAGFSKDSWMSLYVGLIAGAALFLAMLAFWLLRKVGAGDVKLLAVAPLVAGGDYLFGFALLLLLFAMVTALVIKYPLILPASAFRKYVEVLDRKGVVPFGVPISASLIGVVVLQSVAEPVMRFGAISGLLN